jgi:glutamine amidotransferase
VIAVIDYGLGNLTSILSMFRRIGAPAVITNNTSEIESAEKLILPGVGHFKKGMENLRDTGLQSLLNDLVLNQKRPVLGICLGAQLMTQHSEEGDIEGLGWIEARTIRFQQAQLGKLKVPHMGWADVTLQNESQFWNDVPPEPRFYHVHSYHFVVTDPSVISATSWYGYEFVCAFQQNNIYGVQFHPEKSHKYGMKVLENFAAL